MVQAVVMLIEGSPFDRSRVALDDDRFTVGWKAS